MKRDPERPSAAASGLAWPGAEKRPRAERRPAIKVLIGDERFLMRDGIKQLLRRLGRALTILEAADAPTLLGLATEHPDLGLALLDLALPGIEDRGLVALRKAAPGVRVIVLCGRRSRADVECALRSGAAGCIADGCSDKVMLQAIELVLAGGQYLPPLLLAPEQRLVPPGPAPIATGPGQRVRGLSQRQRQVVGLLAEGLSNKMIATRLGLVEGTVKTHLAQIFQILGVHNRTSAVMAIRDGAIRRRDVEPGEAGRADVRLN